MRELEINRDGRYQNRSPLEEWCAESLLKKRPQPREYWRQLEKLTVVIPSYERQDFLLRQCVYWGNDAATIVIVDGSRQPLSSYVQSVFSSQGNIRYVHLPDSFAARMSHAVEYIRTPYCVLLGDDEFHLKTGLSRAIDKLERDPSLVACIGQSLGFYPSTDRTALTYGAGYAHWRCEVMQDDVKRRLMSAMSAYNAATCYAVHREPFWSRSWGAIQPWSSPYAGELQQAIATYIFGKLSTVDEVYWLRSLSENPDVTIKNEFDHGLRFHQWWSSPKFRVERDHFVEILTCEAVKSGQVGYSEAKQMVLDAVESYLELCRRDRKARPTVIAAKIRSISAKTLRALLPTKQYLDLKANLLKLFGKEASGNLGDLNDLKSAGSFSMSDELTCELSEVEGLVVDFYRARWAGR